MKLELAWTQMLWNILHRGEVRMKDDAEIIEKIDNHYFIDPPYPQGPIPMTCDIFEKLLRSGSLDIPNYVMSKDSLADYVVSFNDDKSIHCTDFTRDHDGTDDFVYTYPERLRCYATIDSIAEDGKIYFEDQIDVMISRLLKNRGTNRAVSTTLITGVDMNATDIPCLNWMQAFVTSDNCLTLHVMFRSNDIYHAFPANMYFITYIGLYITERLNESGRLPSFIKFGGIYYNSTSAHVYRVYEKDIERMIG